MAKICPKCGCGVLVGKNCPWCGTKLKDITYLELMRKKPLWALLPIGIVLFLMSFIWVGISRSVESSIFFFIMLLLLFGGSYYVGRKRKHQITPAVERKSKMLIYYGAGIFVGITGIGGFLYYAPVAGAGLALFLAAPMIVIGIISLAYAEHLRRKLKRTGSSQVA